VKNVGIAQCEQREKAIRNRFFSRMETALPCLEKIIAAERLKDRNKMERRLKTIRASIRK